jgi:hypothetical protein
MLLEDEARRGHIERANGRWRLTAPAERRHGRSLREIVLYDEGA